MGRRAFGAPPVAVVIIASIVLVAAGLSCWWRVTTPTETSAIDTHINNHKAPWTGEGITLWNGTAGELRPGDEVVAVEGRSMRYWAERLFDPRAERPALDAGATLSYRVERAGRLLEVPVRLQPYPLTSKLADNWSIVLFIVLQLGVTIYVFARRPHDPAAKAALLLACFGIWAATWWLGTNLAIIHLVAATGFWQQVLGEISDALVWAALLHFVVVFPRPRTALLRHSWLVGLVYAVPFVVHGAWLAVMLLTTSDMLERARLLASPVMLTKIGYPLLVIMALIFGYRSMNDAADRQRLRWLAVTLGAGLSLYVVIWVAPAMALREPFLPWESRFVVFLPAPLAVAAAILRYQAFDIKVVVNRTLVYGFLTACVVGIYVGTVSLLGTLFEGRAEFSIPPLIATALVAVLFGPLREGLQRGVSRLLYGERDEPYRVISRLGRRLESTPAPAAVLPTIVETVTHALRLPYAAIELERGDGSELVVADGQPTEGLLRLPLTYQGETIGRLALAPRGPAEGFSPADHRLLDDLARQAGVAVHAVRLTADLQRSRERLVTAREEERRRLQRDLHDDLGPTLAGIALGLDAIRNTFETSPTTAKRLLQRLRTETQAAITGVRRLAHDLRPPVLDQFGLAHALRAQAGNLARGTDGRPLRVTVHMPAELTDLPAAVEVAAYRITLEALTNAARHAHAQACTVRVTRNGGLELEISDDGRGLPSDYRLGVGLTSMHERAAELGGTFAIEPAPGGGTIVRARLPLSLSLSLSQE